MMNIAGVPLMKNTDRNILILWWVCDILVVYDRWHTHQKYTIDYSFVYTFLVTSTIGDKFT